MAPASLPEFLDVKGVMAETGFKRGVAEAVMRKLPKFREGRRVFVRRSDVQAYLEQNMLDADGFPTRRDVSS
jgi:hypothetical protein